MSPTAIGCFRVWSGLAFYNVPGRALCARDGEEVPVEVRLDRVRHVLIDMDGVLYRGSEPIPRAREFLTQLRARGIRFRLVTNNATLTPEMYRDKLAAMWIEVGADEVFTSALATALYLQRAGQAGTSAYVIGEIGLLTALAGIDVRVVESEPIWVIVGLDRNLTYEKLATAVLAINAGARFLGTNPDRSLPTERGLLPGAGSILAALTAATGVEPTVVGKPQPLMLQLAAEALGGAVSDTMMIGDRLDTDIAAAEAIGMPSILVLTGVSTREEAEGGSIRPGMVVDDLGELLERWSPATVDGR